MRTILIGLTGLAGSGKDTAGHFLWDEYGFFCTAFADAVKEAASVIFNTPLDYFHDREKKEEFDPRWGMTRRQLLQKLGTEACRNVFGDDIWIKRWNMVYDELYDSSDVVVTDVRFDNEAEMIRRTGGTIVHIVRDTVTQGVLDTHSSENGVTVMDEDYILYNNGTLDELSANIRAVVDELESKQHG